MEPQSNNPNRWRLFRRRTCLVPTWQGWLGLLALCALLAFTFVHTIHSFLMVNAPLSHGAIVVEGWLPDYAMKTVLREFASGAYPHLYVTGGPLEFGAPLSEYHSYAEAGAATLNKLGLATNSIQAVPAPKVKQDRTYASALALKRWLEEHGNPDLRLTIITEGAHARRSRLLYQKAFGPGTQIGIIGVPPEEYDPAHWWRSSQGVRQIIGESLAYAYARLLFHPTKKQE